eukprot:365373-Chlamydomonas_euryale.AAC.1
MRSAPCTRPSIHLAPIIPHTTFRVHTCAHTHALARAHLGVPGICVDCAAVLFDDLGVAVFGARLQQDRRRHHLRGRGREGGMSRGRKW